MLIFILIAIYFISLTAYHLPRKRKLYNQNLDKDDEDLKPQDKELYRELALRLLKSLIVTAIFTFLVYLALRPSLSDEVATYTTYTVAIFTQIVANEAFVKKRLIYLYSLIIIISLIIAYILTIGLKYFKVEITHQRFYKKTTNSTNIYRVDINNYSAYQDLKIDIKIKQERYRFLSIKSNATVKPSKHKKIELKVISRPHNKLRKVKITFVILNNFNEQEEIDSVFLY